MNSGLLDQLPLANFVSEVPGLTRPTGMLLAAGVGEVGFAPNYTTKAQRALIRCDHD